MNPERREQWITAARAEAGRRWGWPATNTPADEMTAQDWRNEGKAAGFVAGAMWAIDRLDQDIDGSPYLPEKSDAEFDRWLAGVKADAWDEGHDAATDEAPDGVWPHAWINAPNPYRREADR